MPDIDISLQKAIESIHLIEPMIQFSLLQEVQLEVFMAFEVAAFGHYFCELLEERGDLYLSEGVEVLGLVVADL